MVYLNLSAVLCHWIWIVVASQMAINDMEVQLMVQAMAIGWGL